jgi:cell division protein FtsB
MTQIINCYQTQAARTNQGKRLNLKCLNTFLMALIFIFGILYLINVSDLTVKGFALKEFKAQADVLASEKLDNEEKINNLQSYYSLNSRTQKLNMVAIGEIEYITSPSVVVARK